MNLEVGIACGSCDTFQPETSVRCSVCGNDLSQLGAAGLAPPTPLAAASASASRVISAMVELPTPAMLLPSRPPRARGEEPTPAFPTPYDRLTVPPPSVDGPPPEPGTDTHPPALSPSVIMPPRPEKPRPAPPPERQASLTPAIAMPAAARPSAVAAPPPPTQPLPPTARSKSEEELMEQARNYICKECSTPVPSGHKFCGRCGTAVPQDVVDLQVRFFGAMQAPGKARLILIRGDAGVDGLSYLLQGTEHIAGRQDAQILFPDDSWLSPRHANFLYRGDKLVVRDEGSLNGVYVRLRAPVTIEAGDQFVCGEQVFRIDATPRDNAGPDPDGTYFYSSPKRPSPFRVTQIIRGGQAGLVCVARSNTIQIGREESDINFPEDVYMSARHAKVEVGSGTSYTLTDLGSKNGTYTRIKQERELEHGDYLFLGRQLLRVEISA